MISERNKSSEIDAQLIWRVGIHVDDVIIEGDNIYGNGVYIAARLEAACSPGQILLSSSVKDQVNNKIEFKIESIYTIVLPYWDRNLIGYMIRAS